MRLELVFRVAHSVDDVINVFRYSGEVVASSRWQSLQSELGLSPSSSELTYLYNLVWLPVSFVLVVWGQSQKMYSVIILQNRQGFISVQLWFRSFESLKPAAVIHAVFRCRLF